MARGRHTYKTALRAKGIKPIPPHHRLRSHFGVLEGEHVVVTASEPERKQA